ncbi:MAG: sulfatase, partial [Planctomycetota bacterium]
MELPRTILLIVIDSLRADRMSCYGYRLKTTPFLDSILDNFVKFEWAFSTCSYTVPSVVSILTGKYPYQHSLGVYQTNSLIRKKLDTDKDIMIQEVAKAKGYKTYAIFSAAVLPPFLGISCGFDKTFYCEGYRRPYFETTQIAKEIIEQSYSPTFIFLHYFDIHIPYEFGYKNLKFSPSLYPATYLRRGISIPYSLIYTSMLGNTLMSNVYEASYDSSISIVDNELKKIVEYLDEKKLYDNSLIIITADHGELMGEDGAFCWHGVNLHPVLLRVPLLIKMPVGYQVQKKLEVSPVSLISLFSIINGILSLDINQSLQLLDRDKNSFPLVANHYFFNAHIDREKNVLVYPSKFYKDIACLLPRMRNFLPPTQYRYNQHKK